MPELNLDLLKSRPKVKKKYRPYDIPSPSSSEDEDFVKESFPKEPIKESAKELGEDLEKKNLSKPAIDPISSDVSKKKDTSSIKPSLKSKESTNIPTPEVDAKIAELEAKLAALQGKDSNIPSIEARPSDSIFFHIGEDKFKNTSFYRILKEVSNWSEIERKLFLFLLEESDYGNMSDVKIGRRRFELLAVSGRSFTNTRDRLKDRGVITFREGYIGNSKRKGTFYSINLSSLFK